MNLDKILGNNIRGYRKKRGLTQEALAGMASLSSNYVACLERGEDTISVRKLEKIAKALHVDSYLLLKESSFTAID